MTADTSFDGASPRLSWRAILAGIVVVIAVQLILSVLGTGIGLGFVDLQGGQTPDAASLGTGAGIWWFVTTLISFAFGSYVAARAAGAPTRFDGALHGLVIWGLTLIVTVYLLSTALGSLIGGTFSALGSTVSAVGQSVKAAAPPAADMANINQVTIQDQVQAYMQPANPDPASMSPEDAQKEVAKLVPQLAQGGQPADDAKNRIIDIAAAQMKISREEATQRFDQAQAKLADAKNQAEAKAKAAADATAAATAKGSLFGFVALLVGAIAACVGAAAAQPRDLYLNRSY
ncbi:hypothetical protein SAMN07250955_1145 [Arboricoccus pini]|uniref:PhnA-like protein n=1 Tax=Arboricoccus pini TaxID=1963835 RepID=A0A212RSZ3_9PROT|nr:hypothetical protein [Arboricoccus pini]SNB75751.1 hypothetical protein SAMN07250955_1145 [Arboricoccus pini]